MRRAVAIVSGCLVLLEGIWMLGFGSLIVFAGYAFGAEDGQEAPSAALLIGAEAIVVTAFAIFLAAAVLLLTQRWRRDRSRFGVRHLVLYLAAAGHLPIAATFGRDLVDPVLTPAEGGMGKPVSLATVLVIMLMAAACVVIPLRGRLDATSGQENGSSV